MSENPDHIIIHVGTNDFASNTPAEKVAESIIDLACTLKSHSCSATISSITVRNDKHRNKVAQVNRSLKRLRQEKNFQLINHENTIPKRHLLFNILLFDMFFVMNDIDFASYADDNTPYVSSDSIEDVIRILENDSIKLFKWFSDNIMKANKDKCHLTVSSNEHVSVKLDQIEIKNSNCERVLGVKIHSKILKNIYME